MGNDKREWKTEPLTGQVKFGEGFGWMAEVVGYRALERAAMKVAEEVKKALPKGSDSKEEPGRVVQEGVKVVLVDSLEFLEAPFLVSQVRIQLNALIHEVCSQLQENRALLQPGEGRDVAAVSVAGALAGLGAASDLLAAIQDVMGYFRSDYQVTSRRLPISDAHAFMEVHGALEDDVVHVRRGFPAGLEVLDRWTKTGGGDEDPCDSSHGEKHVFQLYEIAFQACLNLRGSIGGLRAHLLSEEGKEGDSNGTPVVKGAITASEDLLKAATESLKKLLEPRQGESLGLLSRAALWDIPKEERQNVRFLHLMVPPIGADVFLRRDFWRRKQIQVTGGVALAFSLFDFQGKQILGRTVIVGGRSRFPFWSEAEELTFPEVQLGVFPPS